MLDPPCLRPFDGFSAQGGQDGSRVCFRNDVVLNHTGKACTVKLFSTAEYWVDQWRHAVRFAESVDMKYDMGIKIFLKVAPASVLKWHGVSLSRCHLQ